MNASKRSTFYFHADANALGGILKQPLHRTVATHASVSLAEAGGFSTKRTGRFNLDGLISFEAAHVVVSGSEHSEQESWRTTATASIERLNILEVITADRIVAQISVMYPMDRGPAEISFNGTQFVNLRVNGVAVHVELDSRFSNVLAAGAEGREGESNLRQQHAPHFSDLLKAADEQYQEGAALQQRLVEKLGPRFARSNPRRDLDEKGSALCSLVQKMEAEPSVETYGHMLHAPDFGNVCFGELQLSRASARLTMLRLELGCIADGTLSVGTASATGYPMP